MLSTFNGAETSIGPFHVPYTTGKKKKKKKRKKGKKECLGFFDSNSQEKIGLLLYNGSREENKQNTFSYY